MDGCRNLQAKRRFALNSAARRGELIAAPWCARKVRGEEGDRRVHSRGTRSVRVFVSVRLSPAAPGTAPDELPHARKRDERNELDGTFTFGSTLGNNQRAVVLQATQPPLLSV